MRARLLFTAGLILTMTGCSSVADEVTETAMEQAAEQASGGNVDIDTDDEQVSISTDEGSLQIGGGELPEALPGELPLPEGGEVMSSMVDESGGQSMVQTSVTFRDRQFDELVTFFDEELQAGGWEVVSSTDMSGEVARAARQIEGHGWEGMVSVNQTTAGEDPVVSVVLEQKA